MSQRPGHHHKKPPKPTAYAGPTTCLRCDKTFDSWDRRQNRLCLSCHETIAEQPSEEPSYDLAPRRVRRTDHE
jgi:hypothetical protein